MKELRRRFWAAAEIAPEERALAGRVSGALYSMGGLTVASLAVLPGITHAHRAWVLCIAAGALAWGLTSGFLIDWDGAPRWLIHASNAIAFAIVGAAVASSGGAASPAWIYLFFIAIFSSYFYRPQVAALYLLGCVAVHALPLLYDVAATRERYVGELVIAAPAYLLFGTTLMIGKRHLRRLAARGELLASEQGALRRIATAVVEGEAPEALYALVSREAAGLLRAGAAGILRFEEGDTATVVGAWADHEGGSYVPGTEIDVAPGSDLHEAREHRVPVRVENHPRESPVGRLGYFTSIVSPVIIGERCWGAMAVAASAQAQLSKRDERQLMGFCDMLARAIASIDERATLAAQAATDPLTGLCNRRALHERLTAEVSRAQRHEGTLAVAVIDVDHFKHINDLGGHEAGDEMLIEVARCLNEHARAEDTLGRIGGDEFAWIMPETTRGQALVAVERVRRLIAVTGAAHRLTVSAGICDTSATTHPAELINFADSALYWSKAHGRNRCWIYDAGLISELSDVERRGEIERGDGLLALLALARAIDAREPGAQEHSARVGELALKLAQSAGWSDERALLLREAALMHDVGKVGVPDGLLAKAVPLSPEEMEQVRQHAELTARIVEGVLTPEQVAWIRSHHEWPDGSGYPQGMSAEEIPEGGALLAIADAFDAMTGRRPYSDPKSAEDALRECERLAGRQFTAAAVAALRRVHGAGGLKEAEAGTGAEAPLA